LSFKIGYEGELTKKQEETVAGIRRICFSFYDKSKKAHVPRKWDELVSIPNVSRGFLSKHLRELISQGVVNVERKLDEEGRLATFYTYTGASYQIKGKKPEPPVLDAARIYYDKKGIQAVTWGYSKLGRSAKKDLLNPKAPRRRRYFIGRKPFVE
jgi:predicted ArsR family transcriptional regulator